MNLPSPLTFVLPFLILPCMVQAQIRPRPVAPNTAIVVDERLSPLRTEPLISAQLLRRVGRGRRLVITAERRARDGLVFYKVRVTRRTSGWIQREALICPRRRGEDRKLFRLILGSKDFDRLARARIFLQLFPGSPLRPRVLLLFGDAAQAASEKLSRVAARRLGTAIETEPAPEFSYFLNYAGLDRYNRQGIRFVFDRERKEIRYDGNAYREIVRRYPLSPEAVEAHKRLN